MSRPANVEMIPLPNSDVKLFSRFRTKVNITDGCWLWTGARDGAGYGRLRMGDRLILVRMTYQQISNIVNVLSWRHV